MTLLPYPAVVVPPRVLHRFGCEHPSPTNVTGFHAGVTSYHDERRLMPWLASEYLCEACGADWCEPNRPWGTRVVPA